MTAPNLRSTLARQVRRAMTRALSDYSMIAPGDRVMAAVSGGKDSTVMVLLLDEIRRRAPFPFTIDAVLLDQKQPGFDAGAYAAFIRDQGIALTIVEADTYRVVKKMIPEGKTYCSLCSRLRRGVLYSHAAERGFHSIALGHHRDDLLETLLMNIFYAGRLGSMPPRLRSSDGRNRVIRPLVYVDENDLVALAAEWRLPIIPCSLCGSQDGLKRNRMRDLLDELQRDNPGVRQSVLASLGNVEESQLMDRRLWDFAALGEEKKS